MQLIIPRYSCCNLKKSAPRARSSRNSTQHTKLDHEGIFRFFLAKGKSAQDVLGRRRRFSCPFPPQGPVQALISHSPSDLVSICSDIFLSFGTQGLKQFVQVLCLFLSIPTAKRIIKIPEIRAGKRPFRLFQSPLRARAARIPRVCLLEL